jgi:hypothetical protein
MLVSSGNLEQKMCLKQRSFYGQNIIVNFAFFYKTWLCSDGSNLFKLLGVNFLSNNFFFFTTIGMILYALIVLCIKKR